MTSIDVRTITDAELEPWVHCLAMGFNSRATDELVEWRRATLADGRSHGAFDGDTVVGTARAFGTSLTVPGNAEVPVGAVTAVSVLPTARRRGVLTAMMAAQLDDIAQRGEVVAILIAAEAPIYGRFGYGNATTRYTYTLDTDAARFARRPAAADQLRVVDNTELRAIGPAIYDRVRRAQPGAIRRDDLWWDRFTGVRTFPKDENPAKQFHVVCGDEGWLTYLVQEKWEAHGVPNAKAEVHELVAATPEAYAALWWYMLELDWVGIVEAGDRPPVEPVTALLTNSRTAALTERWDFIWVRLLDAAAALTARSYGAADRLVLDVGDPFRPEGEGRFALDTGGDRATWTRTDDKPDLALDVRDLGAAYLGQSTLHVTQWVGGVNEYTPGAVARFDRMFHNSPAPWCSTWF